jgi:NADH-quinone oxidoreductase subunit E
MLSDEERQEIEAELAHYMYKREACVEVLKILQRHRRWISDDSLHDAAEILEMTVHELDNVATFYSLIFREPVGKHVILLCDSVSCWLMGYERIRRHLQDRLGIDFGQTTEDEAFTLLPMPCLGTCDHAPAMMIDEELYRDLDEAQVDKILGSYQAG